jgi:hypothetical protein
MIMKRLWLVVPVLIVAVALAVVTRPAERESPPPPAEKTKPAAQRPPDVFAPYGKERLVRFALGRIEKGTAEFSFVEDAEGLYFFALTGWKGPVPACGKMKLEVCLYDAKKKKVASAVSTAVPHSEMPIFGTLPFPGFTRDSLSRIAFYSTRILFTKAKEP